MIRELFSRDIDRRIEEVIKVDQTDEAILREELEEYVVTRSIKRSYLEILEEYAQRPNQPSCSPSKSSIEPSPQFMSPTRADPSTAAGVPRLHPGSRTRRRSKSPSNL